MSKNFKYGFRVLSLLLVVVMLFSACGPTTTSKDPASSSDVSSTDNASSDISSTDDVTSDDVTSQDSSQNSIGAPLSSNIGTQFGSSSVESILSGTASGSGTTENPFTPAVIPTVDFGSLREEEENNPQVEDTKSDDGSFTYKSAALSGSNKKLTGFKLLTEKPVAYEMVEFEMNVPELKSELNVYKESDVDITMELVSSTGTKLTVDAFYFEEYEIDSEDLLRERTSRAPAFRIRVSPQCGGTWDFTVTLAIEGSVVDKVSGYINVDNRDTGSRVLKVEENRKQTFKTVSGKNFAVVGQNLCWNDPILYTRRFGQYTIDQMEYMAEFGGNMVRIWDYMDSGSRIKAGVHKMYQDSSAMWDAIFETAAEEGVYVDFVLMNHGEVSTLVDARWSASIFHANQGGYITHPSDFFTDRDTIDAFKTYVRYIVARWGYSEYIFSWELFNEINHTNGVMDSLKDARNWLSEIADYVREIDPYNHMVSNSTGSPLEHPLATYSIFDFIYYHQYNVYYPDSIATTQKNTWLAYEKPVLFGEMGLTGSTAEAAGGGTVTNDLTFFHQTNWAGLMGGGGGTTMNWAWYELAKVGGHFDYKVVSEMAARIPFDDPDMFMANTTYLSPSNNKIEGMGYRGNDYAYLWFYDRTYTCVNRRENTFTNETAELTLDNGVYYVRWVNTWTGVSVKKEKVTVTDGTLTLNMPTWSKDIAVAVTVD